MYWDDVYMIIDIVTNTKVREWLFTEGGGGPGVDLIFEISGAKIDWILIKIPK